MVFELHIWGPAFGLPSIDAECIAASAYMNLLFSQEEWNLVIAHDPSRSPTGDFPVLRHELQSVGGFSAIVEYLASQGHALDTDLSPRQRSDSIAIRAHLTANAQPMIDATLYASSSNYTSTTRPAWTKILPPHANLVVPSQRHVIAKSRSIPLGLSSDSVDDLPASDFSPQQEQEVRMLSSSPSLIFKKRQTLQDALKAQQSRTIFRLESLTDILIDPLARLLDGKTYLLRNDEDGPCSIDCLALGYLALLILPDVPNAWVAETIEKQFKGIVDYVRHLQSKILPEVPLDLTSLSSTAPLESDVESDSLKHRAESSQQSTTFLWRRSRQSSPTSIFQSLTTSLLSNFITPLQQHLMFESNLLENSPPTALRSWTSPLTLFLTLSGPVFATLSYILYTQTHLYPEQDKRFGRIRPRLQGLGEAGATLSVLGGGQWGSTDSFSQPGRSGMTDRARSNQVETDDLLDGQAKLRQDQDRPEFSDKPGVSVEIASSRRDKGSREEGSSQ